jgi:ABC-2 type transport system ATP-binding protein
MPKKNETAMAPLIEAKNLTKRYGSHVALDNAQLSIEPGRIVGLVGPNGAGKTSALRAILGLTTYEGQLTVLGREPFRERTESRHRLRGRRAPAIPPRPCRDLSRQDADRR